LGAFIFSATHGFTVIVTPKTPAGAYKITRRATHFANRMGVHNTIPVKAKQQAKTPTGSCVVWTESWNDHF
jgi:hypothetical protein